MSPREKLHRLLDLLPEDRLGGLERLLDELARPDGQHLLALLDSQIDLFAAGGPSLQEALDEAGPRYSAAEAAEAVRRWRQA